MPRVVSEVVFDTFPDWQNAYVALLSSLVFERVRSLGQPNLAISQARTDIGFALQAVVDDEFKRLSTSQAIAVLTSKRGSLAGIISIGSGCR